MDGICHVFKLKHTNIFIKNIIILSVIEEHTSYTKVITYN